MNPQANPVEIGITINSQPVSDNVIHFEVVATIIKVSIVYNIVDKTP